LPPLRVRALIAVRSSASRVRVAFTLTKGANTETMHILLSSGPHE